jgi:hypothetical protein
MRLYSGRFSITNKAHNIMRSLLAIFAFLLLPSTQWTSGKAPAADFTQIDKLRARVAEDLRFIDAYKAKRDELVKASQAGIRTDAVKPFPSEVQEGIDDLHLVFGRLSKMTDEAKNDPTVTPDRIKYLEGEWFSLKAEAGSFRDSLANTPPDEDPVVLVQFLISYKGEPAEGWHVNSVGKAYVDKKDQQVREAQITDGCRNNSDKFFKSLRVSAEVKDTKVALIEQFFPIGGKYFWVQDDSCESRSNATGLVHVTKANLLPCVYGQVGRKCLTLDLSAPARKPYKQRRFLFW